MRLVRLIAGVVLVSAYVASGRFALAQGLTPTVDTPNNYPPEIPPRKGPPLPNLVFKLDSEIPLPGPLPGLPPSFDQGRIRISVAAGIAVASPSSGLPAEIVPSPDASERPARSPEPSPWVVSANGRLRFRSLPEGRIEAEKKGLLHRGRWRRAWDLRVAGATPSPPVLLGRSLFFASVDNQVYAVRQKNGHRLWATDLEERVSGPLALWRGTIQPAEAGGKDSSPREQELVLVVPDGGSVLVGLDPYDGGRVAALELGQEGGRLLPGALALPDGRIVVARESYTKARAALMLLSVTYSAAPKEKTTKPVYNPPSGGPVKEPRGSTDRLGPGG